MAQNKVDTEEHIKDDVKKEFVVRFAGDSGDGMQLSGSLFANLSASIGLEISTFPDFPAEIRAPQGTLGGVSGYQLKVGESNVFTPGESVDVLVVMNPAALKTNVRYIADNSILVVDIDSFGQKDLEKAKFKTDNPFEELGIKESVQIVPAPLTTLTLESLKESGLDRKSMLRSKNMFALGTVCWLFDMPLDNLKDLLNKKFLKKPSLADLNYKVLNDGYNYASNLHLSINFARKDYAEPSDGARISISGNKAIAWGLIAAAEKANKRLFLGSYPITPASDIMHELAQRKDCGVMVVQAEDEIAAICSAIGASYGGDLAATSTSGPGLSLKSEALGLAVMAELPLVVIDVQRGGPSTGLPTKTEQTDLLQALYGRNGESPLVVLAASTPSNCFRYAYEAAKLALENMTPVILLSDAYLANGTSLWTVSKLAEIIDIYPATIPDNPASEYNVAMRDENGVRYFAAVGTEGFEHRNMGLERDMVAGTISTDPDNHEKMVKIREQKIEQIKYQIPLLFEYSSKKIESKSDAVLLVGFGSTEGHLKEAVMRLTDMGKQVALAQFNYIKPLPYNAEAVLRSYKKVVVCELSNGQFANYLRQQFSGINIESYTQINAQPLSVKDLVNSIIDRI